MKRLSIIGVGLIGGSIGIDAKQAGLADSITGVVRRRDAAEKSVNTGAVDYATLDIAEGVKDADMVILAAPPSAMPGIASIAAPHLKREAAVTDTGSVKGRLVYILEGILGKRYVGSHPMAGSEKKGLTAAKAGIFKNAVCIITPTADTHKNSVETVKQFWQNLGANTITMTPEEHDRITALTSHLPHLAAAGLVNVLSDIPKAFSCAGRGFRDMTRIAEGPAELWSDICKWNKEEILNAARKFRKEMSIMISLIESGDIAESLKKARKLRNNL